LLVGEVDLVLGDASDGLREVSLGLAQGLRAISARVCSMA
jgi:hypothetical protein